MSSFTFFDFFLYSYRDIISSIITFFTFTMRCTFFPSNKAFTITFQTFSFFAFATPDKRSVKYIDITYRVSLSFWFNKVNCFIPFFFMFSIIVATITIAVFSTKFIIMKALAIEFKTVRFWTMAWTYLTLTDCLRNLRIKKFLFAWNLDKNRIFN